MVPYSQGIPMQPADQLVTNESQQLNQQYEQPQPMAQRQWENISNVVYYPNATSLVQIQAALMANGDVVELHRIDETTGQIGELIMRVSWSEISNPVQTMNIIKFTAQGKSIRVDFNRSFTKAVQEMPMATNVQAVGLAFAVPAQIAEAKDMKQGLDNIAGQSGENFRWWLQAFQSHGLEVKDSSSNKVLKHPFLIVGLIIIIPIVLYMLYSYIKYLIYGY